MTKFLQINQMKIKGIKEKDRKEFSLSSLPS